MQSILQIKNNTDVYLLNDTMNELAYLQDNSVFYEGNKKPKCKLLDIHDEIMSFSIAEREKEIIDKEIDLTLHNQKPCIKIDGYEVKLPKNGREF